MKVFPCCCASLRKPFDQFQLSPEYWPAASVPFFVHHSRTAPEVYWMKLEKQASQQSKLMFGSTSRPCPVSAGPTLARKLRVAASYADAVGYFASVRPHRWYLSVLFVSSMTTPSQP